MQYLTSIDTTHWLYFMVFFVLVLLKYHQTVSILATLTTVTAMH